MSRPVARVALRGCSATYSRPVFNPLKLKSSPGRSVIGRGKRKRRPALPPRQLGQLRSAGITESEQLGRLVERLARRIVERAAQDLVLADPVDVREQRMTAGNQQRDEREIRAGPPRASAPAGAPPCGGRRWPARPRRRRGCAPTRRRPAGPRPGRARRYRRHRRPVLGPACTIFRALSSTTAATYADGPGTPVRARRRRSAVQGHLAVDFVREQAPSPVVQGHGRFVARGFDTRVPAFFAFPPGCSLEFAVHFSGLCIAGPGPDLPSQLPRFRCPVSAFVRTSISMPPCAASSVPAKRRACSPSCAAANSTRSPRRNVNGSRPPP